MKLADRKTFLYRCILVNGNVDLIQLMHHKNVPLVSPSVVTMLCHPKAKKRKNSKLKKTIYTNEKGKRKNKISNNDEKLEKKKESNKIKRS